MPSVRQLSTVSVSKPVIPLMMSWHRRHRRSLELFLRITTPSGREFGWPVHAGTIGYDVAKEIAGLASEGEPVSLSDGRKRKSAAQGHQPNCVLPCPSSLCGGPSRRRFPRCCQKRALGSA